LVRALDAGALTGARTLRSGQAVAEFQARAVAEANGYKDGVNGISLGVTFGTNADGEQTVTLTATQPLPTILMRILGLDQFIIAASSTAAVPPVDLVLVIDQSWSLINAGAWDDLQDAARDFVDYFDNSLDKMALISFNTRGTMRHAMSHNFRSSIKSDISAMTSVGYTNYGEGFRLAEEQITGSAVRDQSVKIVVFFTDGRPTAFRGSVGGQDRIMTVRQTVPLSRLNGYYNSPDTHPSDSWGSVAGCSNVTWCGTWWEVGSRTATTADGIAHDNGRTGADLIRSGGALIYTIGLGDPNASAAFQPNQAFMQELANVSGAGGPLIGKYYFAPDASELEAVFNAVAQDILVRLSQ
jgi:hypothetical protein